MNLNLNLAFEKLYNITYNVHFIWLKRVFNYNEEVFAEEKWFKNGLKWHMNHSTTNPVVGDKTP